MPVPVRLVCKVLCPDDGCGSFIGEKGCRVKEMETETNTLICVSKKGEYFPSCGNDQLRVISIAGFKVESIIPVLMRVIDLVENNNNHISHAQCVLVTSPDAAGFLLGSGGQKLYEITKRYNRLNINFQKREEVKEERYVEVTSLIGKVDDVKDCCKRLIGIICQDSVQQPMFEVYYSQINKKSSSKSADFDHMTSTWENLMKPLRKHSNRKPSSVKKDEEHDRNVASSASIVDCSIIKDGKVVNCINGTLWEVATTYTVYSITKDSWGEIVFQKIN